MALVNENYLKLSAGYLFPEISRRVAAFADANPDADLIKMGIGDVTEPLPEAVREAMHAAVDEMGKRETFRGYGPEQGYPFLRQAIVDRCFKPRGVDLDINEVFVSDGSKCDSANLLDIFGTDNRIAVCDPVYPVYVDTNVMAGHTGPVDKNGRYGGLVYLPLLEENDFGPQLPTEAVDLIYLCCPNNPTGTVVSKDVLKQWVDFAREHDAVIFFDAAYEGYITNDSIPHSIYEIDGANECAIELRSFSKTAGFTGTRCAYTIIPTELKGKTKSGEVKNLHPLWSRRQSTKFNGVSYIVQRGAEAALNDKGNAQIDQLIEFYMANAAQLRSGLIDQGYTVYGGINAPYVWLKTPEGMSSWEFFDDLLERLQIIGTPGSGFGAAGEGYLRLSAFNSRENIDRALARIKGGA